eukprot:TRINITY_DN8478_c0_g1_i1.p1 TRINITY_DN8478_c0_g1~~TRINITY_DN8478_c0_g1_i1.p1  ORF type:complete len:161 (+),score=37.81 TRINITY_DN8478_c0_g1_i1:50-532(+)
MCIRDRYQRRVRETEKPRKYLLCTDGSEAASRACDHLIEHMNKEKDEVIILAVSVEMLWKVWEDIDDKAKRMHILVDAIKYRFTEAGVNAKQLHTLVLRRESGDGGAAAATEAIETVAEENKVDCIVMGRRGIGNAKRALLGSVSSYIVRDTNCTVWVVP